MEQRESSWRRRLPILVLGASLLSGAGYVHGAESPTGAPSPQPEAGKPADGTWRDAASGKTWQNPPSPDEQTLEQARKYCADLTVDGGRWRLPTVGELRSLVRGCPSAELKSDCKVEDGGCLKRDCKESCARCPSRTGAGEAYWPTELLGNNGRYWSSSVVEDVAGKAWVLDFKSAGLKSDSGDDPHAVRCVR